MNKRERIEQAVIDLGGFWPGDACGVLDYRAETSGIHKPYFLVIRPEQCIDMVCTRAEFEHVVGDMRGLYVRYICSCAFVHVPDFETWLSNPQMVKEAKSIHHGWRTPLPTEREEVIEKVAANLSGLMKHSAAINVEPPESWHEAGELPPVGEICNHILESGACCKVMVMARDGDFLWLRILGASSAPYKSVQGAESLRSLESEKLDVVREARTRWCRYRSENPTNYTADDLTKFLYDEGMLKLPERNQ